jgi:aspartate dehydrogenase
LRFGLIGLGAIGRAVVARLQDAPGLEMVGALVADPSKPRAAGGPPIAPSVEALLVQQPQVVVEAGGHGAVRAHVPALLRAGVDVLLVSVGALADPDLEAEIRQAALDGPAKAIVVSGAIGGLDALAAAAVGGLDRVTHTTRKPARALLPPAEAETLREPRELFRGRAREGVLLFPESINVVAAVSLAGVGFDRTEVCVIADPDIERNQHDIVASGAFGELRFGIANIPSRDNPKTGRLVAMSVVHALHRYQSVLVVG